LEPLENRLSRLRNSTQASSTQAIVLTSKQVREHGTLILNLQPGLVTLGKIGLLWIGLAGMAVADSGRAPAGPHMFAPVSTPAHSIYRLAMFVLVVAAAIFLTVASLLVYSIVKYRRRSSDDGREPPQVYGSNQVELAWTVLPVLIVVVLFLAAARVIHSVGDPSFPAGTTEVTAVGHQFWWEFRYPQQGFVSANELHVPLSDPEHPTPTHITLLSADTDHSFWVPRLAGKTDLIPNRVNSMWIDPHETGVFLGQCAQYCGTQHAKMLLRVVVQSRQDFERWAVDQLQSAQRVETVARGRQVFEATACVNCHTVAGTNGKGTFGPDLTHLMSRETIAAGAAPNTPENLRLWVKNPDDIKPGALMPAMQLNDKELNEVVAYLSSLR
jgi:cytochrome c oxidase subunit 2